MTSIIPQARDLNTTARESLGNYRRGVARNQGKIFSVIDGPVGRGGTGKVVGVRTPATAT